MGDIEASVGMHADLDIVIIRGPKTSLFQRIADFFRTLKR